MRPDSKLCFDFSLPVDKSHLEELESEKEDEKVAKYCPTKENLKDAEEYNSGAEKVVETDVAQEVVEKSDEEFRKVVSTSMVVAVKVASEKVGQKEVKIDEVLSDDITGAKEEDNYYEDDLNTSCMLFSEKLSRSLEEAPDDESCNDQDDFDAED